MQPLDLLVGSVAFLLGLVLLIGAVLDPPWLMALTKPRFLAEAIGKPAARIAIAVLGIGLIVLGIAIASGWRMRWTASRTFNQSTASNQTGKSMTGK